jgi:hypothetical protein
MFDHEKIDKILQNTETIMSTTGTGLMALQTFANTTFPAFVTQQTNDLGSLTTAINTAISILGSSEDAAVQTAVAALTTALGTVESNQASLESLSAALVTAEGTAQPAVKKS